MTYSEMIVSLLKNSELVFSYHKNSYFKNMIESYLKTLVSKYKFILIDSYTDEQINYSIFKINENEANELLQFENPFSIGDLQTTIGGLILCGVVMRISS